MIEAPTRNQTPAWIWRIVLSLIILGISLLRHFSLISTMWQYIVWFGTGLILGISANLLDRRFLVNIYRDAKTTLSRPVTQSLLFYICLIPVSLFVVTSSGSALGAGLILGLWIGILADLSTAPSSEFITTTYLYQLKKTLSSFQINWLVRGVLAWLVILIIWVMF